MRNKDAAAHRELFTDDAQLVTTFGTFNGVEAIAGFYRDLAFSVDDLWPEPGPLIVSGDRVAVELRARSNGAVSLRRLLHASRRVSHHPYASGEGRGRYRTAAAAYSTVFSDFVPEVQRMVRKTTTSPRTSSSVAVTPATSSGFQRRGAHSRSPASADISAFRRVWDKPSSGAPAP
jgi:hypothetical protein